MSDSDFLQNTKGCLNQNTIQWGNGFKNAGYTLLKTHLRHRSENKEVALLIRSRDAPVLSCHIHEKFPAQHITLSTFFILLFFVTHLHTKWSCEPYACSLRVKLWCIPWWKPNQVNSCNSSIFKIPLPILTQIFYYKKYVGSEIQKKKI